MYKEIEPCEILKNLKQRRSDSGFNQKQVEKKLGLRALSIYDFESGRLKLSVELAIQLANLYHCSLDELVGLKRKETSVEKIAPQLAKLVELGFMNQEGAPLLSYIYKDPIFLGELGVPEIEIQKSPFELLLGKLTDKQKKGFVIELLKYLNSLIGIDDRISPEELSFRNFIIASCKVDLEDSEENSIKKAISKPYFGKSVEVNFPRLAFKHFLIWVLLGTACADGELEYREEDYIKNVASHVGVPKKSYNFIRKSFLDIINIQEKK